MWRKSFWNTYATLTMILHDIFLEVGNLVRFVRHLWLASTRYDGLTGWVFKNKRETPGNWKGVVSIAPHLGACCLCVNTLRPATTVGTAMADSKMADANRLSMEEHKTLAALPTKATGVKRLGEVMAFAGLEKEMQQQMQEYMNPMVDGAVQVKAAPKSLAKKG